MSWGALFKNPAGPLRVTIIGCGKSKLPGKHRAEDLYTGGLFRASLDTFDEPVILPQWAWRLPRGAFGESCGPT